MKAFDASSIIHAWDNYPVEQFPPLWNWITQQIDEGEFVISKVALEETEGKSPDCAAWLKASEISQVEISNEIVQEAMRIKGLLGISDDKYHPNGVGENDILIIATAKITEHELISDEARQLIPPQMLAKMRIPAVCGLEGVAVQCRSFIELVKHSRMVFQ